MIAYAEKERPAGRLMLSAAKHEASGGFSMACNAPVFDGDSRNTTPAM